MTGAKLKLSDKKNDPSWGFHDRVKLAWFKGRDVEFRGSSSPPATRYSPKADKSYPKLKYSFPKDKR